MSLALGVVLGAFETRPCSSCARPIVHKQMRYYARHGAKLAKGEGVVPAEDHDAPCGLQCANSPSLERADLGRYHYGPGCAACLTSYGMF